MSDFRAQNVLSAHAPLIYSSDPDDSPFQPRKFVTIPPLFIDRFTIDPKAKNTSFGTEVEFEVQKNGGRAGFPTLITEVSALAAADVGTPNSPAFVDYAGIEMIDKIELIHDTNSIQTVIGHSLRLLLEAHMEREKQSNAAIMCGGGLTLSQHQTKATAPQTFTVNLNNLFFGSDVHNWFPVKHFGSVLRVKVTYKPLGAVCTTTNGLAATGTITGQYLKLHYSYHTDAEMEKHSSIINGPNGMLMPYQTIEEVKHVVPANYANPIDIDITPARSPCHFFSVEIRKKSELETLWACDYDNWMKLNTMSLTGNNQLLIRDISHEELLYDHRSRFFNGPVDDLVYYYSFALDPSEVHDQTGAQFLGALSNQKLRINMTPVAYEVTIVVNFFSSQFVQLMGQQMKKLFF